MILLILMFKGKDKNYEVIKQLGKGTFGIVFLVKDEWGNKFALKRT